MKNHYEVPMGKKAIAFEVVGQDICIKFSDGTCELVSLSDFGLQRIKKA